MEIINTTRTAKHIKVALIGLLMDVIY